MNGMRGINWCDGAENLRCPFRAMFGCVQSTWGGVHPHSRIHLPQADMLCPFGAKRNCFDLKEAA